MTTKLKRYKTYKSVNENINMDPYGEEDWPVNMDDLPVDDYFTGMIRVHLYSDPDMGWGDSGSVGYYKVDLNMFNRKKEIRHDKKSAFYTYRLNENGRQYLKEKCNYSNYGMGWDFITEKRKGEDLVRLKKELVKTERLINEIENIL